MTWVFFFQVHCAKAFFFKSLVYCFPKLPFFLPTFLFSFFSSRPLCLLLLLLRRRRRFRRHPGHDRRLLPKVPHPLQRQQIPPPGAQVGSSHLPPISECLFILIILSVTGTSTSWRWNPGCYPRWTRIQGQGLFLSAAMLFLLLLL